jgi:hypothetical protein
MRSSVLSVVDGMSDAQITGLPWADLMVNDYWWIEGLGIKKIRGVVYGHNLTDGSALIEISNGSVICFFARPGVLTRRDRVMFLRLEA